MVKLLKYSDKLKPLMTVGRNITDPTTRKTFEEMASILLDAVEDVDLSTTTTSSGSSGISYALATGTWTRASGHGSHVTCRAASDPIGTTTADPTTFEVYLPRSSADKDPNVYAGDVLQYVEVGGTKYALGESYLSAKIGTLGELYHNDVPNGWAWCDGSGSTPDLRLRFTYGANDNTEIGDEDGHDTHTHGLSYTQLTAAAGAGAPGDFLTVSLEGPFCATGPYEFDAGDPNGCASALPYDDTLPPYTKTYKIIRVGPSGEVV